MYSGNAVVVNLAMRFPWLVPVVAAVGVVVAIPKEVPPPPQPVPVVAKATPVPVPAPIVLKPVEALCPPADKLTKAELNKLTPKERGLLKVKGCIKG
jgi:hypothetical protein